MKSIDQLKAAVDSASSEVRAAYVSFTVFALYFAITVGATSHEQLLRGSEVTMPALGVGLPIVGFYLLVPPLFVLFHALLLMQLSVLANRVRQLRGATSDHADLSGPPFVLSQFLLGNIRGVLLRPIIYAAMWVSLILLPIALLVFVQVRFLPYHDELVTWWHRSLVILDLALIWLLWPQILSPARMRKGLDATLQEPPDERAEGTRRTAAWPRLRASAWRGFRYPGLALLTVAILIFSLTLATIPQSPQELAQMAERETACPVTEQNLEEADAEEPTLAYQACRPTWNPVSYFEKVSLSPAVAGGPRRTVSCASYLLFEAPTTPLNMRRNLRVRGGGLVSAPPSAGLIEELGLDKAWQQHGRGLDLRGRDLRYADLSFSDLKKVDLRGADLLGADLSYADLRYARAGAVPLADFDGCEPGLRTDEDCLNRLSGANLRNADLRFSHLRKVDLRQANLNYANLQGADLTAGRLEYASALATSLEGAELLDAVLDRAQLKLARLAGANLSLASLHDSCLREADLTLAHLKEAQLVDADLSQARLDGAFLPNADLSGATLTKAYFAGADLRGAELDGATLGDDQGEAFFGWADLRGIDEQTLRPLFVSFLERVYGDQWHGVPFDELKYTDEHGKLSPSWTELGQTYRDTLKTAFGLVRHDVAPGALPDADPAQYEADLASLLAGKACRPDASPFLVPSLVKRMVDDIKTRHEHRVHQQRVANRLLGARRGSPFESGNSHADNAPEDTRCRQVAGIPEHMRRSLRAITVLILDDD